MPRVERNAEVTLVVLVYRSLRWLDFCMEGVDSSKQETRYRWCVVSNDGAPEVRTDPRVDVDWENEDPNEHYIARTYRAWNEGMLNASTNLVILLNTDMYFTNWCIDELIETYTQNPQSLPCSLLVENGRIRSAMSEYVQDFGTNPDNFRLEEFQNHADKIRQRGKTEPGRLFQPVLFDRQQFFDLGAYPCGNIGGVSGDKILFDRYVQAGFNWVTCLGSVVAHIQEGETRWP